jgi:hypothetical protein
MEGGAVVKVGADPIAIVGVVNGERVGIVLAATFNMGATGALGEVRVMLEGVTNISTSL